MPTVQGPNLGGIPYPYDGILDTNTVFDLAEIERNTGACML